MKTGIYSVDMSTGGNRKYLNWLTLIFNDERASKNPSVAQKSADEVVFRHFQDEGVEFF